jgi:hypothetical protein
MAIYREELGPFGDSARGVGDGRCELFRSFAVRSWESNREETFEEKLLIRIFVPCGNDNIVTRCLEWILQ